MIQNVLIVVFIFTLKNLNVPVVIVFVQLWNVDSHLHLFALQYVYMPYIDQFLAAFRGAWNRHSIRTADNLSPIQLWVSGTLQNYYSHHSPVVEVVSS